MFFRPKIDDGSLNLFINNDGVIVDSPERPIKTIVDAGANIGTFSLLARRLYPNARIYSIEPEPSNYELLRKNTSNDPLIATTMAALWFEETHLKLYLAANSVGHHVEPHSDGLDQATPAITMDMAMRAAQFDEIDLLKIDIEGAEAKVFAMGNTGWISRVNSICFECNDADGEGISQAVFAALSGQPFDCYSFDEHIFFVRRGLGWTFRRMAPGRVAVRQTAAARR